MLYSETRQSCPPPLEATKFNEVHFKKITTLSDLVIIFFLMGNFPKIGEGGSGSLSFPNGKKS